MRPAWAAKPLSEVVTEFQPGFACRPSESGGEIPQLRPLNMTIDGTITLDGTKGVAASPGQLARYRLERLDVLFNNTNSPELVGKVVLFDQPGTFVFSNHLTRIRVNQNAILPRFLQRYLFLLWVEGYFKRLCTQWVNQAAINVDALGAIHTPLPPLREQQRIVSLLDAAEELRRLREQADRRTADLIPAIFHDMFGDPEHTSQPVRPLHEIVTPNRPITYGILKPGPDVPDGIPYVRVVDIKQNHLHVDQLRKTTESIANEYRRSTLRPGDILVTIRGTVGRTCVVPDELHGVNITQDTARVSPVDAVDRHYLVEFVNTAWAQRWMTRKMVGQAVRGINLGDLKKLPVPVPPLSLQRDFAARVAEVRALEAQQAASRRRLDDLFQSLLHRAFRGEL